MRKITVFTATRAEYGLLYWLIKGIDESSELELQLIVSGTHLSPEFGNTFKQIEKDGFSIDEKIESILSSDSAVGVTKSLALVTMGLADSLDRLNPDMLILLGDRYETLGAASAALLHRIPIVHIHGGEITEGAYDDSIRHAITKLSQYHFTTADEYRDRVVQLGEEPSRVFNVGAVGLDHIKKSKLLTPTELSKSVDFDLSGNFFLITYHPVTLSEEDELQVMKFIFEVTAEYADYKLLVTYPNADDGGRRLIQYIDEYAAKNTQRVCVIPSLGQQRYLSAVKHCEGVIGNSSSGIIEVPSLNTATINIGDRQKGRLSAGSVIHCSANKDAFSLALSKAISESFKSTLTDIENPYGDGGASDKILSVIADAKLTVEKSFYNL